ncbi:hypothetical protein SASPL_111036 [Salvia splendens]|uniref:Myb/SANT-like domain-containing protein n=1 Tax=Salvia splendens TaxID=180675 RepID=A0A8X8YA03_SALSN|nr:hypothetical protein SASPL_111036 [Salvia splendens]
MSSHHNGGSEDDGSSEGSNDLATNKNVKADRSRRVWSVREEEILMATLKELAANGWKSDNGFHSGYLVREMEGIKREFPKTDILPHPHIYSKITTWKRNYGSLKMMLNHCGIGFNSDGTYRIECDDEQWAQFVKDRADDERGVDVGAAVGKIYGNKEDVPAEDGTSHPMTLEELFPDEVFPEGIHNDTNERLKAISTRIGYEFDLSTKRTEVFDQLKGIPGLSLKRQFYISKKLVKEPELMDLFRGLPETARVAFVFDLLETDEMI